jgi:hypothetical protein
VERSREFMLDPVSLHGLLELPAQRRQTECSRFELVRVGRCLFAGLSDIADGLHHLDEADLLLVGAGDNLLEGLDALLDV